MALATASRKENGCGTLTMTYVHDPGKVIGTILADRAGIGTYRYYFQDNIGSTRRLRDDNKTSLGWYEYTPYGQVYLQSGATIRYKFTGKEWDDTADLYYFPFRYYSPDVARWIERDPMGMVAEPNLYSYVRGQVVSSVDPLGLWPWTRWDADKCWEWWNEIQRVTKEAEMHKKWCESDRGHYRDFKQAQRQLRKLKTGFDNNCRNRKPPHLFPEEEDVTEWYGNRLEPILSHQPTRPPAFQLDWWPPSWPKPLPVPSIIIPYFDGNG